METNGVIRFTFNYILFNKKNDFYRENIFLKFHLLNLKGEL